MNRCAAPNAKLPIEFVVFGDDSPRNVPAAAGGGPSRAAIIDAHQLRPMT
jgi:hypothetical protein